MPESRVSVGVGRCTLTEDAAEEVLDHISSCSTCQALMETMDHAEDTLLARLMAPVQEDAYADEPERQEALARARTLVGATAAAESLPAKPTGSEPEVLGRLGEYQLLEELGAGGMGTVYKAVQTNLDRVLALKVLSWKHMDDPDIVARFYREMKAVGRLNHPNIVQPYDAREIEETPILAMEYVEGPNLSQIVKRCGPLPIADACELVRQAAVGLQYAHQNGLVHRDIKPSNLMLALDVQPAAIGPEQVSPQSPSALATDEGWDEGIKVLVKILDLGLARLTVRGGGRFDFDRPDHGHLGLHGARTMRTIPRRGPSVRYL